MHEIINMLSAQSERLIKIEAALNWQKTVLNLTEAAKLTGISKSQIYKLTSKKEIPHYKQGKHLYFDRVELENWLKEHRQKTISEIEAEANQALTIKKR